MRAKRNLSDFYVRWLPRLSALLLGQLATCMGRFTLAQRELCLYTRETRQIYHTPADLLYKAAEKGATIDALQYGGIFPNREPRDLERETIRRHQAMTECAGELVFDVDLDAAHYNRAGICGCGTQKQVCDVCWRVFMDPAQRVVELMMDYYGFRRWFKVFSGRRGFHVWVLDSHAVSMTERARKALLDSLTNLNPATDPLYQRAYEVLAPLFDRNPVLLARAKLPTACPPWVREQAHRKAVFDALFPKFDEAVTVRPSHLHKAPLVPHRDTGYLCLYMGSAADERTRFVYSRDTVDYFMDSESKCEQALMQSAACIETILLK